ncbi:hypothetical protein COLO4_03049 [Corchorus olitorius]|uniref:Uncharacterized protein n=1 Tax=Corchorus olitorius TaxID=93759 RepID=A0A1R3KZL2_9ROSI|nr:hypothetical protein COLO4_03049 [Corchorus olitorius]
MLAEVPYQPITARLSTQRNLQYSSCIRGVKICSKHIHIPLVCGPINQSTHTFGFSQLARVGERFKVWKSRNPFIKADKGILAVNYSTAHTLPQQSTSLPNAPPS